MMVVGGVWLVVDVEDDVDVCVDWRCWLGVGAAGIFKPLHRRGKGGVMERRLSLMSRDI